MATKPEGIKPSTFKHFCRRMFVFPYDPSEEDVLALKAPSIHADDPERLYEGMSLAGISNDMYCRVLIQFLIRTGT